MKNKLGKQIQNSKEELENNLNTILINIKGKPLRYWYVIPSLLKLRALARRPLFEFDLSDADRNGRGR